MKLSFQEERNSKNSHKFLEECMKTVPHRTGLFLARSPGYQWCNWIVKIFGNYPYFEFKAWDLSEYEIVCGKDPGSLRSFFVDEIKTFPYEKPIDFLESCEKTIPEKKGLFLAMTHGVTNRTDEGNVIVKINGNVPYLECVAWFMDEDRIAAVNDPKELNVCFVDEIILPELDQLQIPLAKEDA